MAILVFTSPLYCLWPYKFKTFLRTRGKGIDDIKIEKKFHLKKNKKINWTNKINEKNNKLLLIFQVQYRYP